MSALEGFYVVGPFAGYEPEFCESYEEACELTNSLADEYESAGWHLDRSWASTDNLYCVRIAKGSHQGFLAVERA